jgi:hypothetical protein
MAKLTIGEAVKAAAKLDIKIAGLAPPKKTLPKTKLGGLADALKDVELQRLAVAKVADALKAEETRIREHLIETLDANTEGGAVGLRYKAVVVREDKPVVEDWDKFYEHIRKKKAFDLLNKAVNASAMKARWEDGKSVPGVGSFHAKKISLTKV